MTGRVLVKTLLRYNRKWSVLPGGLGSAYWLHRRSARDGGEYAGRGFGGFAS